MTGPKTSRFARLAARLLPAAYRDDVVDDLVDERDRLIAPATGRAVAGAWLLWQIIVSAFDSRRVLRAAGRVRAASLEDRALSTRHWLPSPGELRLAARAVWRARTSSGAIVLTLALAIGGTTAMFSVVQAVLLEPLPYANPDRLVRVWERHVPRDRDRNVLSPANYVEWRDRVATLADSAAFVFGSAAITGDGPPERVPSGVVTWNLFDLLGVRAAEGRVFIEPDLILDRDAPIGVAVLGWDFWQRRYGGDRALIGRSLLMNGRQTRVVGILPAGFRLFDRTADVWTVLSMEEAVGRGGRSIEVVARLAPGATVEQAHAEMNAVMADLEVRWPDRNPGWRASVYDARADLVGDLRRPLWLLLAAVAIVLLVGCANAANLLLARAAERRREFAVRTALGATRGRLLRQLLIEGLILAGQGTAGGVLAGGLALRGLVGIAESAYGVPRLATPTPDLAVFAVAFGLLIACTLAFGLAPGWLSSRPDGSGLLTGVVRVWTGSRLERRARSGLVIAQVAFAVLLVIAAALVTGSFLRLSSVDPGFDPEGVLTLTVSLPGATYTRAERIPFFERIATDLRALPGVEHVGAIAWIPFGGPGGGTSFDVDGRAPLPAAERPVADIRPVDAGYFAAMRIPVVRGRVFTPAEVLDGARVAVVNETLAARLFPNEDPIGKRLQVNWNDGLDEIVGVVGDVKINGLDSDVRSQIYFPHGSAGVGFLTYVVRTPGEPMSLARPATVAVQALDPDLPVRDVQPLSSLVGASVAAPSASAWLVSGFGGLALLLALVGIAGLQTETVVARLPEFGIRLALGATPGRVRRQVLADALRVVGFGLAIGLAAAVALSRLIAGVLYDVPATNALLYAITAAVVLALGLLAAGSAVRRATRVDPAVTLRG